MSLSCPFPYWLPMPLGDFLSRQLSFNKIMSMARSGRCSQVEHCIWWCKVRHRQLWEQDEPQNGTVSPLPLISQVPKHYKLLQTTQKHSPHYRHRSKRLNNRKGRIFPEHRKDRKFGWTCQPALQPTTESKSPLASRCSEGDKGSLRTMTRSTPSLHKSLLCQNEKTQSINNSTWPIRSS